MIMDSSSVLIMVRSIIIKAVLAFLPVVLMVAVPIPIQAQTKRALVIGLGEQADKRWPKINGDKDVPYACEMLSGFGFNDIQTLVNQEATKAGILTAFQTLTEKCENGDIVYIHFSGHGQQVRDVSGDEKDGLDEAWIPYDACVKYDEVNYKGENHLIDDEINLLLFAVKQMIGENGKILVVVDACHSGSSTRPMRIKKEVVRGGMDVFEIPKDYITRTDAQDPELLWLTLSACSDKESNQELKTPQVGKLTYALYFSSKYAKISMNAVEQFMRKYRSVEPQHPMLTGVTDKYQIEDVLR